LATPLHGKLVFQQASS